MTKWEKVQGIWILLQGIIFVPWPNAKTNQRQRAQIQTDQISANLKTARSTATINQFSFISNFVLLIQCFLQDCVLDYTTNQKTQKTQEFKCKIVCLEPFLIKFEKCRHANSILPRILFKLFQLQLLENKELRSVPSLNAMLYLLNLKTHSGEVNGKSFYANWHETT